jgi:hypothetical protein
LLKTKLNFRRVTVLIFRIRNTSASAHTNYLVNFLKSSGNVCSLIKAAYSTANRHLVNRYKKKFDNQNL